MSLHLNVAWESSTIHVAKSKMYESYHLDRWREQKTQLAQVSAFCPSCSTKVSTDVPEPVRSAVRNAKPARAPQWSGFKDKRRWGVYQTSGRKKRVVNFHPCLTPQMSQGYGATSLHMTISTSKT